MRDRGQVRHVTKLELRATDLPKGVCGIVQGVALVYGVTDHYDTMFKPGCLDRTKREKLAAGKVALFRDHEYGVSTHIGIVRALETIGDAEVMTAQLFDTEDGREAKEYIAAVLDASAQTGLSIGFWSRETEWVDRADGDRVYQFNEIELEEISLTPRPAVPGAQVTGVRSDASDDGYTSLFRGALTTLGVEKFRAVVRDVDPDSAPPATPPPTQDSDASPEDSDAHSRTDSGAPATATMDERLLAYRRSYL
jgi:HK97 family phage prohead protease